MRAGGLIMRQIKPQLQSFVAVGMSFADIEAEAQRLIKAHGVKPNFSTVPGYHWATCIMKNDELCHGIPSPDKKVADGDVMSIDVGILYGGYHLDTSISFGVGDVSGDNQHFLEIGKQSLRKAINKVKAGVSVYEVSAAMQRVVERAGYSAVYQLTGHGVGEELHMEPAIPCIAQRSDKNVWLTEGQTIAVEIMYAKGDAHLKLDKDGWTYRTSDGSISAMFEETVLVTARGYEVLT
jgi:methionyl aminopeptidase